MLTHINRDNSMLHATISSSQEINFIRANNPGRKIQVEIIVHARLDIAWEDLTTLEGMAPLLHRIAISRRTSQVPKKIQLSHSLKSQPAKA
jgi:hypothetical protein